MQAIKIRSHIIRIVSLLQLLFFFSFALQAQTENARLSQHGIKNLDTWLNNLVKENKIPGAVYVITQGDKILGTGSVGYADISAEKPLTNNSIFRITSMTKAITAVALMTLYEEGKFLLTDPVSKYIPAFKNVRIADTTKSGTLNEITILDLLDNTSGLPSFSSDAFNDLLTNAKTNEEMALGLAKIPLEFNPGTAYLYGASYEVLGYLIQVISGKHLDEFYNERIFSPLHMNDTYFFVPKEKQNRIAGAYRFNARGQATQLRKSGEDDGDNQNMFDAAGGIKTTATDFAKFCQMLLNGGSLNGNIILSPSTVKLMLQDHVGSLYPDFESGCGWGFGGEIVNNLKRNELSAEGTYRWGGFYGNQFFVDVHNNLAAIIMIQMFPNYDLGVQSKFEILVRQAVIK